MQASSPSTSGARCTVFFSHKNEDKLVTKHLIELLDENTENVDYFFSEKIEKGAPWRQEIVKWLDMSSYLVLVFTDPDEDWGWCLYETGFFDALSRYPNSGTERRIYCLHHAAASPPSPIEDLQSIPAIPEKVEEWLEELYKNTNQTKEIFIKKIPDVARKICDFFTVEQKPLYQQKSIGIDVNCSLMKSPDDLPGDTMIEGEERLIEELFGNYDTRIRWNDIKGQFKKSPNSVDVNMNTLKEISRAIWGIYQRDLPRPVQGIIFVGQGPKRYRPIINHAKALGKERINCEVLLIEEVGGPLQNVDKPLGALLTSIRIAVRIRWEIIRPFASTVRRQVRLNGARKLRFDLQTCFNNIFLEAEFRGHFSPEDLLNAFESAEDQEKVDAIMEKFNRIYPDIWKGIGFPNATETFGEVSDQPMTEDELARLEAGLHELKELNRQFLEIASPRADFLIKRELDR
jgi:hypothetical protein